MTIRFSEGLRDDLLDANPFKTIFQDGIIEIRTGSQPATANDAATGTLLATVTQDGGAFTPGAPTNGLEFGSASGGAIDKDGNDWEYTGVAAGTAGWFRLKANALDNDLSSTTLQRVDGSIAKTGGDMNLTTVNIAIGTPGAITQFEVTIPAQ